MKTEATVSPQSAPEGAGKQALMALFMVVFIDLLGFGMVLPLVPQIADEFANAKTALAVLGTMDGWPAFLKTLANSFFLSEGPVTGWLFSLFSLMNFLFSPFWGGFSDRVGRKPILVFGLVGSAVGHTVFALSFRFGVYALLLMYVSRVLSGISGANIAVANAYIADHTAPENRTKAMGLIGAAFGLGFILGPAVGGIMAKHWGWGAPFWFASALSLVSAVLGWFVLKDADAATRLRQSAHKKGRAVLLRQAWKQPKLQGALILFFLTTFAFANLELCFVLFCKKEIGLTEDKVGFFFFFAGLVIAFTQGFAIRKLSMRYTDTALIQAGQVLTALGLFFMPFSYNVYAGGWGTWAWVGLIAGCIFFIAFGNGINNPALTGYISAHTPEEIQGGIMGAAQSLASLGRVLGPIFAGWIYSHFGARESFFTGAALMGVGVALALTYLRGGGMLKDRQNMQAEIS